MTDQKPKYLNTSDTMVFNKSQNLYALNFAKNAGEKKADFGGGLHGCHRPAPSGLSHSRGDSGTSLTTEQARLIARYAQEAVICYDSDGAGQKATARAIPMLREAGLLVRVLTVTGGKDPDEFIRSHGDQARPDSSSFWKHLETMWNIGCKRPQTAWIYPSLMGKSHI